MCKDELGMKRDAPTAFAGGRGVVLSGLFLPLSIDTPCHAGLARRNNSAGKRVPRKL
jgi:hypothetical protein